MPLISHYLLNARTYKGDVIIIIIINCNWVVTRWQRLFYM